MPGGRPTEYTEETGDIICEELVHGKSLNRITQLASMPSISTVYRWLRQQDEFRKKYEQSRLDQVETLADEIKDISDNVENGTDNVQRDRLRVDTRKWIAERMKPTKYGPKSDLNINAVVTEMPTITRGGKEIEFDIGTSESSEATGFTSEASDDN